MADFRRQMQLRMLLLVPLLWAQPLSCGNNNSNMRLHHSSTSSSFSSSSIFPKDRCLRIAVGTWPAYIRANKKPYSGFMIDLFQIMVDHFKFCYQFVKSPDGLWGSPFPNGSWYGLMGLLQRKEADMALGPFALSYQREQVADFSVPFIQTEHVIIYRTPRLESDLLGFVKPYSLDVWIFALASLLFVSFFTFGVRTLVKILNRADSDLNSRSDRRGLSLLQHSVEWVFKALVGQDTEWAPRGPSLICIAYFWLLTALVLASAYKSNLMAMLIAPKVTIPINSLEDLVDKHSYYPWALIKGSFIATMAVASYEQDRTSSLGKLWHGRSSDITNPLTFIPNVRKGLVSVGLRFSSDILNGAYFSKNSECAFYISKKGFVSVSYSVGLPQDSPLKNQLDDLFLRLAEGGILSKLLNDVAANLTACPQPLNPYGTDGLRPLSLADLQGVAALFAIGMICAALVFAGELLLHHLFH